MGPSTRQGSLQVADNKVTRRATTSSSWKAIPLAPSKSVANHRALPFPSQLSYTKEKVPRVDSAATRNVCARFALGLLPSAHRCAKEEKDKEARRRTGSSGYGQKGSGDPATKGKGGRAKRAPTDKMRSWPSGDHELCRREPASQPVPCGARVPSGQIETGQGAVGADEDGGKKTKRRNKKERKGGHLTRGACVTDIALAERRLSTRYDFRSSNCIFRLDIKYRATTCWFPSPLVSQWILPIRLFSSRTPF